MAGQREVEEFGGESFQDDIRHLERAEVYGWRGGRRRWAWSERGEGEGREADDLGSAFEEGTSGDAGEGTEEGQREVRGPSSGRVTVDARGGRGAVRSGARVRGQLGAGERCVGGGPGRRRVQGATPSSGSLQGEIPSAASAERGSGERGSDEREERPERCDECTAASDGGRRG